MRTGEIEPPAPVREAVRGAVALGVRQVLVQGANVGGLVVLSRVLSPGEFGAVAVVTVVMGAAVSISALGLDTSLVRAPADPGEPECRAVTRLALGVAGVLSVAALALCRLLGGGTETTALVAAAGIALLATAFQVVPRALLERRLAFAVVARAEVVQAWAYNAIAAGLAWHGWGVASIGPALVARGVLGAVCLRLAVPHRGWPHGSLRELGPHLRFGVPMLATGLVSHAKDAALPALVGTAAGAAAVGLTSWAQVTAAAASLAPMILARVYLPAFARVQADPLALERAAAVALRASHAIVAPVAVLTFVLVEPATRLLFGAQWLPALPVFRLLWIANVFAPTSIVLLALLGARGRSNAVLAVTVAWAAGIWLLGAPLVFAWGATGYGVANVAVQAVTLVLIRVVRREVAVRPLAAALPPWLAAIAVGLVVRQLDVTIPVRDVPHLAVLATLGLVLYGAALLCLRPRVSLALAPLPERG